ncbi:adenine phosphoribosyltransferase [Escherichia coli]|uniref:Adenine phosphoribosyltransferase n=1 Tax=Escherichia coli TaxID=562 RepID=A0A376L0F3_ECOLX|nr:adenine phosphoribosyltransferase [Escherichia coli]
MSPAYWKTRKLTLLSIDLLVERYKNAGITKVVGTEARGFLFGAPVALGLGVWLLYRSVNRANCRVKPSVKLTTWNTAPISWRSTLMPSNRATKFWWWTICWQPAGTIEATVKLIRRLGGEVADAAFIINLFDLGGEQRLEKQGITSYSLVPVSRAINYRQSCAAHATDSTRCAFSLAVLTGLC